MKNNLDLDDIPTDMVCFHAQQAKVIEALDILFYLYYISYN
ncbi:MAG: hypothetical protein AB1633_11515 [Elusimicrobiota bacterium]